MTHQFVGRPTLSPLARGRGIAFFLLMRLKPSTGRCHAAKG